MDRWLENEVDRGTRRIEAVLKSQMDELHEKRMSELQVFKEIFERHEEVGDGLQIYKQGYEEAAQEREAVKQRFKCLAERNEELARVTKEVPDFFNEEKDKVAMYEKTFYSVLEVVQIRSDLFPVDGFSKVQSDFDSFHFFVFNQIKVGYLFRTTQCSVPGKRFKWSSKLIRFVSFFCM